jgi:DNA mismatch repair protein MutL
MSQIQVLSSEVVGKIAAGEVLERPANLIKELIENSLDAGADQVEIEFDSGGREVCVSDNGSGIARDELRLALERHATSKISEAEDLYRLHSFGFRGEALASIAAVSSLTLTSRKKGAVDGYRLHSEFGRAGEPSPVSAREGTEIRVRQLFENVPARLRFLKSEAAEHGQIKTTLKALALAHENAGFKARSRGELVFNWPKGQGFKARALQILQAKSLYEGRLEMNGIEVEVLVSSPMETLNVNRGMWFFVQGRWVQDRSLSAAVMEAYRNLLMHGEYPSVVVRIRMPTDEVDVNVHPTKAQVKFRDSQAMFRATCRAVREVLEKAPWLQAGMPAGATAAAGGSAPVPGVENRDLAALQQSTEFTPTFQAPEFERTQYPSKAFPLQQVREIVKNYSAPTPMNEPHLAFRWQDLQVIGQLNQTYIVAQNAQAMYLVDQHAAHERVVFERLMTSFQAGRIEVQNLLLPMVFDMGAEEVEALVGQKDAVEKMGLSLERMGPESVAVQAIPTVVSESAVSEALEKLAHEIVSNGSSLAWERVVGDIFASMACHSVIRAGQSQSTEQMKSLLVQMDDFPLSSFCPHGRPVFIKRSFGEIEREFGRIV